MSFLNAIIVGLREILAHKFRSLLTMLGIVLGVSSLVAMAAIVKGMENGMKEAMIALGGLDKALTREAPVPVWQSHLADQAPGRTLRDVEAHQRQRAGRRGARGAARDRGRRARLRCRRPHAATAHPAPAAP